MNFRNFLNEASSKPVKDALALENPEKRKEYLEDIVLNNVNLLKYAVSIQKNKVLSNISKEAEQNILEDLMMKLRKWENLYNSRWPENKTDNDPNLSTKPAKPNQPPVDPSKPAPLDIQNQLMGNTPPKDTPKK